VAIVAADGADYRQDATPTVLLVIHCVGHTVQAREIAIDCAHLCSSPAPGGISQQCCRTFKSFDRLLHAAHTHREHGDCKLLHTAGNF